MPAVAASIAAKTGQPSGLASIRAITPGRRPMFIVFGSSGSNGRPHSGHRLLANPVSAYPHPRQQPTAVEVDATAVGMEEDCRCPVGFAPVQAGQAVPVAMVSRQVDIVWK